MREEFVLGWVGLPCVPYELFYMVISPYRKTSYISLFLPHLYMNQIA